MNPHAVAARAGMAAARRQSWRECHSCILSTEIHQPNRKQDEDSSNVAVDAAVLPAERLKRPICFGASGSPVTSRPPAQALICPSGAAPDARRRFFSFQASPVPVCLPVSALPPAKTGLKTRSIRFILLFGSVAAFFSPLYHAVYGVLLGPDEASPASADGGLCVP